MSVCVRVSIVPIIVAFTAAVDVVVVIIIIIAKWPSTFPAYERQFLLLFVHT